MKICNKCEKEKELEEFVKYKKSLDGRGKTCKRCHNESYNNWYHSKNNAIKKNFSVDHDHITGSNRGLLCTNCNFLLGYAKDNIFILINAIQYLKTWEEE